MPPFHGLLSSLFRKFTVDRGHGERSERQTALKRLHAGAMLKAALRSGFTSSGLEEDEAKEEESTAVCSQSHSDLTQVPSPYLVPVPE